MKINQVGFSMVELILAMAIFVIFSGGSVALLLQGFDSNRLGVEQTIASQYATEGIEAVRSIKNQDFAKLSSPGIGVTKTGGVWAFDSTSDVFDKYTRVLSVEDVYRDANGEIKPSGTLDLETKKITSTVSWNFNSSRQSTVSLTTYLSDWRKPIVSGGPVMMAYSKTTSTPFYRIWDGSIWGAESSAQSVGGAINFIVLKSSRTRNEAILGTLDANGNIYTQLWNGSSWGTPTLMANITSSFATYRSFDIEYEKNGDRAVIVYRNNASPTDFTYRVWADNNWSAPTTVYTPPNSAGVRWLELAQNPVSTSNEIAMIMVDQNKEVYGMVWNGNSWNNMGVSTVWGQAAIDTTKTVDVAYEQNSGRAMFIWAGALATDQYFRVWNGSALSAPPSLLDIPTSGGLGYWVELVSRPNSDEIMYGVQTATPDLNTRKWSGSAWDTASQHPEHDTGTENNTSMNFDLIWETHPSNPGKAWLLWGDAARVSSRQWSGTAWGSASIISGSDDTSFVRLKADPASGAVFAGIYESLASGTDDIWETHLTGGSASWSAENTIWTGPISAEPVYFRVDIAAP